MLEHPLEPSGATLEGLAQLSELRRRLRSEGRPVAVLCLGAASRVLEGSDPGRRSELTRALLGLVENLPPVELAALPVGDEVLVLLEADPDAAALVGELLVESGRELCLAPGEAPRWIGACVGLALDPADRELYLEALVAVAQEGVSVARGRGGECLVHTRLYSLMQRRSELARAALSQAADPVRAPQPPQTAGSAADPAPVHGSALAPAAESPQSQPAPEEPAATPPSPLAEVAAPAPSAPADGRRAELERRLREHLSEAAKMRRLPPQAAPATPGPDLSSAPIAGSASHPDEAILRELARQMAAEALESERRQLDQRHREEISLLERRIQRLVRALEETEQEMRHLAELAAQDPGIPSAYRSVRGLDMAEESYAIKRELMAQLLEANLELRRRIAESAA